MQKSIKVNEHTHTRLMKRARGAGQSIPALLDDLMGGAQQTPRTAYNWQDIVEVVKAAGAAKRLEGQAIDRGKDAVAELVLFARQTRLAGTETAKVLYAYAEALAQQRGKTGLLLPPFGPPPPPPPPPVPASGAQPPPPPSSWTQEMQEQWEQAVEAMRPPQPTQSPEDAMAEGLATRLEEILLTQSPEDAMAEWLATRLEEIRAEGEQATRLEEIRAEGEQATRLEEILLTQSPEDAMAEWLATRLEEIRAEGEQLLLTMGTKEAGISLMMKSDALDDEEGELYHDVAMEIYSR
jgi:hypothetical protein